MNSSEKSASNKVDESTPSNPSKPRACANGCGFFGSPATANMCSSCYKKTGAEKGHSAPVPPSSMLSESKEGEHRMDTAAMVASADIVPPVPPASAEKKVQANKNRCWQCKKKLGFTGVECKCGYTFCGEHRFADSHACDFDYKKLNKSLLEQKNPVIVAAKLNEKL